MIFKYLDLQTSVNVVDDFEIIDSHKLSVIRNINIKVDGTLHYPEPLDENLIELVGENKDEELVLLYGVTENAFYYDRIRDKYLDLNLTEVTYYMDGANKKNQYMHYTPNISSLLVPAKLQGEYCLTGISFYCIAPVIGTGVVDVKDTITDSILHTLDLPTLTAYFEDLTLDILFSDVDLASYIGNVGLDSPVIILKLRKTYYPTGV